MGVEGVGGVAGDPGREGEAAAGGAHRQRFADPLGGGGRPRLGRVLQEGGDRGVAVAAGGVALPEGAAQGAAQQAQRLVAAFGPGPLEPVQLEDDQRQRLQVPAGRGHPLAERHPEVRLVDQAGDRVVGRQPGDRVAEVDGDLVGRRPPGRRAWPATGRRPGPARWRRCRRRSSRAPRRRPGRPGRRPAWRPPRRPADRASRPEAGRGRRRRYLMTLPSKNCPARSGRPGRGRRSRPSPG